MIPSRILLAIGSSASIAVLGTAAALAASAPKLKTHADYSSSPSHGVHADLVTSATNPNMIIAGPAPIGSQFATGGIYVTCSKATKSHPGLTPFMGIAFPALKLKLTNGRYGFTKKFKFNANILGSTINAQQKLTVTFKGTVTSSTLISGSVGLKGASKCTSVKSAGYKAKYNPNNQVAPGQ